MVRTKTREITLVESQGVFNIFKTPIFKKEEYDFSSLLALRQVLNNEKARLIHVIKTQNPISIYELAKKLGRDFKSVSEDIKLLKRFGFIELIKEKTKRRIRHKPVVVVDNIKINIKI